MSAGKGGQPACVLGLAHPAWAVNGAQPGGHDTANAAMGGAAIGPTSKVQMLMVSGQHRL